MGSALTPPEIKLKTALAESSARLETEQVAETLTTELDAHAKAIVNLRARTIETSLEIGQHLEAAHQKLAGVGRDGAFGPWVKAKCGFSASTAYRYRAAYLVFGKCRTVTHFESKALYLLSLDSCPEAATKEAIHRSKKGERITYKVACELKRKHTSEGDNDSSDEGAHATDTPSNRPPEKKPEAVDNQSDATTNDDLIELVEIVRAFIETVADRKALGRILRELALEADGAIADDG